MESLSRCCFVNHPHFLKELEEFIAHHGGLTTVSPEETLGNIEKLLTKHFYDKVPMFTGKHMGQAQGFKGFPVYWLHLVIPNCNLSRTQLPKVYLYKSDLHICFLCLDSHLQNYKDAKLRKVAEKRLMEILEVLKTH